MSEPESQPIEKLIADLEVGESSAAKLREITALLRAQEQRARESEERYRLLADALPHMTWTMRADRSIEFVNRRAAEFIGLSVDQINAHGWHRFIHPEDLPAMLRAIDGPLDRGEPNEVEHRFLRHDGIYRQVLSRAIPMKDDAGKVIRWVGTSTDIHDRWLAEQALRESESRLNTIVENLTEGLVVSDLDGELLHWNRAALDMYGMKSLEEARGKVSEFAGIFELSELDGTFIPLEDWPLSRILRGEQLRNVQVRVRRVDLNLEMIANYGGTLVRDTAGRPMLALVTISDITERMKAQENLAKSESRLRIFIEHAPAALAMFDRKMKYLIASLRWRTDYHLGDKDIIGRSHYEVFPEISEEWRAAHDRAQNGEVVSAEEDRFIRMDGTVQWVKWELRPWFDLTGRIGGIVMFTEDITARKHAADSLREHEQRLSLSLEAGRLANWDINLATDEMIVSPQLRQLFGLTDDTQLTTREQWRNYLIPADRSAAQQVANDAIAANSRFHSEFRIRRSDGEIRWIATDAEVIADEQGRPARLIGVCGDITDRKQSEIQMRLAKEAAEEANRAKDHFLAVLSHELRTPMAPILTGAQLLEGNENLSTDVREVVTIIRRNAELEARLIDDLLDLTRITRGQFDLRATTIDLHEKIRHITTMCAAEAEQRQITLAIALDAPASYMRADPARLQQIIWNLLKNAIKFTPTGGSIRVSTVAGPDNMVRMMVADTGIGIAPELLPRIFDAFEQGGTEVMRRFGGLGLGLAIAKNLVEMHGGTISAASDGPGQGATFTIELPLTEASARDDVNAPADALRRARCTVLLVEDHTDTRRLMIRLLEEMGCTVHVAATVAEVRTFTGEHVLDLLLSDIGLTDGTGFEVVRHVKKIQPGCKAIAVSGFGTEADLKRSIDAGFDLHLTKPVDLRKLEQILRQISQN